jgi:hypothetical protein
MRLFENRICNPNGWCVSRSRAPCSSRLSDWRRGWRSQTALSHEAAKKPQYRNNEAFLSFSRTPPVLFGSATRSSIVASSIVRTDCKCNPGSFAIIAYRKRTDGHQASNWPRRRPHRCDDVRIQRSGDGHRACRRPRSLESLSFTVCPEMREKRHFGRQSMIVAVCNG